MTPQLLLAISGVFVFVAVIAATATSHLLTANGPERRRLRQLTKTADAKPFVAAASALTYSPDPVLARLSRLLPKSPKEMSKIQRRLARAGYPQMTASVVYSLSALLLPFLFAAGVVLAVGVTKGWIFAVLAGAIGYALPGLFVIRKTTQRQKAINNGLPD